MKFAVLGHLLNKSDIYNIPKNWIKKDIIVSPEININETIGYILGIKNDAEEIMNFSRDKIRKKILNAAIYAQNELDVEVIQLGGLTTSVTDGGEFFLNQNEYKGFVNHGDSYTAAVTGQAVKKALNKTNKNSKDLTLSIVGSYGIIGEALSKILVPQFKHSLLIGRREKKLRELASKIDGSYETSTKIKTEKSDVIITATNHPDALLKANHLKNNAIVVDVSQPSNLSYDICKKKPDVLRIDGGFVDLPEKINYPIPGIPKGKIFSCVAEIIMQAIENEKQNHVGSIDLNHLKKTEEWGKKYNLTLKHLTNFGKKI